MNQDDINTPPPNTETKTSPRKIIKRDEDGCIEGFEYKYTPDGLIDWRNMIPSEHLVVNKQWFESRKKSVPDSIEGLKDNQLLILLAGIKYLSSLRGFTAVRHKVTSSSSEYVVSVCEIDWLPNFETEGRRISFSAIGDASLRNTSSFASNYLGPIAENRAFVRAVRNFLRINVCGQDEIAPEIEKSAAMEDVPSTLLSQAMKDYGLSFEQVKEILVKEGFPDAEKLGSIKDIPKHKIFDLIGRIKKKQEEKTKS
jgi:hypothetical protein